MTDHLGLSEASRIEAEIAAIVDELAPYEMTSRRTGKSIDAAQRREIARGVLAHLAGLSTVGADGRPTTDTPLRGQFVGPHTRACIAGEIDPECACEDPLAGQSGTSTEIED